MIVFEMHLDTFKEFCNNHGGSKFQYPESKHSPFAIWDFMGERCWAYKANQGWKVHGSQDMVRIWQQAMKETMEETNED